MDVFYVYEDQEIGPPLRIPLQFGSEEEALEWVQRRKSLPAFSKVNYTVERDNPQRDAAQAEDFRSA